MRRTAFVLLVGFTLGVSSPRTDHDVVETQHRAGIAATRIFTGPDGQTHAEEMTVKLARDDGSAVPAPGSELLRGLAHCPAETVRHHAERPRRDRAQRRQEDSARAWPHPPSGRSDRKRAHLPGRGHRGSHLTTHPACQVARLLACRLRVAVSSSSAGRRTKAAR